MNLKQFFTRQPKVVPVPRSDSKYNQLILRNRLSNLEKTVQSWKNAVMLAEDVHRPRYENLQEIYKQLAKDTQLQMVKSKIILELQSSEYTFIPEIEGKKWFNDLIENFIDGLFYGYTITEVSELDEKGLIKDIVVLPRKHINPVEKVFYPDISIDSGLSYQDDYVFEQYTDDLHNLGELDKIVPYIIYYNACLEFYIQYLDRYSTPTKVVKTDSVNSKNIQRLHEMMSQLGRNAYCIVKKEEEVNFINTLNINGDIFKNFQDHIQQKITKLVLGAVIGESSDKGGSRSKEEVGERTQKQYIAGYKQKFTQWVNNYLIDKLKVLGYSIPETAEFKYTEKADADFILNVVNTMKNSGYKVNKDWLEEKLNIELDEEVVGLQSEEGNSGSL